MQMPIKPSLGKILSTLSGVLLGFVSTVAKRILQGDYIVSQSLQIIFYFIPFTAMRAASHPF